MFLASDLGGYAAVASILFLKVPSYIGGRTESSAPTDALTAVPMGTGRGVEDAAPYGTNNEPDAYDGGPTESSAPTERTSNPCV